SLSHGLGRVHPGPDSRQAVRHEFERRNSMLWIVVALIVLTFGVTVIAAVRLHGARRAVARCRQWQEVTGRVISLSVREGSVDGGGTEYVPVVVYRYMSGDTQYESERL